MSRALIQVVDENDQPTGSATKEEVWRTGLIHRCVRVMVEDGQGNVLLQKRGPGQELYPNCWDNSAAGHVDAGEDYDTAAHRELAEELGLVDRPLQVMGTYFVDLTWQGHRMRRFARVYRLVADHQTTLKLGTEEVAAAQWWLIADAKRLVAEHPEQIADGLQQTIERFYPD